jgi:hypothetical protein
MHMVRDQCSALSSHEISIKHLPSASTKVRDICSFDLNQFTLPTADSSYENISKAFQY